jgi:uncharacterized protein YndB with AHSA1/START domain
VEVRSRREYRFDAPAAAVWEALGRVEDYRSWWPWLRRFDAPGLVEGASWRCTIRPPLPYSLRLTVHLEEVQQHAHIAATVTGDVEGDATIDLHADEDGCVVELRSALAPSGRPMRTVARFTPWIARFGHDWVLDTGLRQFRRRALG